ncbi:putative teichuronic acid biosynthesis glycosyltransferase TuaG [Shewanella sairae]|uniref:Teichuronic acid biosynthesis glycosyltransferase TuaG n=1 Tax=Shewanella sairae TaxID=190310 RepID=A0ABQ4PNJ3_9GAMM|nr:glycosyltransferase family 2 protein [Shewanella sairae]MCL1131415.1 glycosyltransferase [Shewanella sairae]GIU49895.1 putative teichuronic acid biosynthesis glycosyltransferase TuaG [Shewanella sairae]
MNSPLVSIITPAYNCSNSIAKTIDSVLNQTYQNWEMLISDDCSSDDSSNKIQQFAELDSRIKLIRRSWNAGPAVTRNRAISEAKGRYIAFLDADDTWYPSKLEKQIAFMQSKKIALSYTGYRRVHEDGRELGFVNVPSSVNYTDILKTNSIGCLTACYDSDMLGKVYMPNIAKRQDLGLWLRILKKVEAAYALEECLADYYVGVSSVSANKVVAAKYQWRIYRDIERLSVDKSLFYFIAYATNAIRNRM